jgi:2-polyprenyl-6-methoxyphenol hydroxylase-like FAD-dependent oxidoreductase
MPEAISVQCCIAGGGLAGMMLGLLLTRFPLRARIPVRMIGLVIQPTHAQRNFWRMGYFG